MLGVVPADGKDDSRTTQEPESAWRNVSLPCLPHHYIVYGHRHAVRLFTRLIAIGLLVAAILVVLLGSSGSAARPARRRLPPARTAELPASSSSTATRAASAQRRPRTRAATPPPAAGRTEEPQKPAKPIPPDSQIPDHGAELQRHPRRGAPPGRRRSQSFGYADHLRRRRASGDGLPTIVQYAKGYGPAARSSCARQPRQRAVRDAAGRHPRRVRPAVAAIAPLRVDPVEQVSACGLPDSLLGGRAGVAGCDHHGVGAVEDRVVAGVRAGRARARLASRGSFQHQRW